YVRTVGTTGIACGELVRHISVCKILLSRNPVTLVMGGSEKSTFRNRDWYININFMYNAF
ncbi:hypothetical protein, partial [Clostridioides sp. GD02404]|uniref:hypothetical protein n=1 Tax=Clostridioides sp. GD02404 TaxID=3054354 RepID=UPI0038B215A1